MPTLFQRNCHIRIAFERLTDCIRCDRHLVGLEQVQHAPDADSGSILVVALGIESTLTNSTLTVTLLPQEALGLVVAVQDSAFRALGYLSVRQGQILAC